MENCKRGFFGVDGNMEMAAIGIVADYIKEHFPNEDVISNCFLCEYAESAAEDQYFSRCLKCPIAWNSSIHPTCTPGIWAVWNDDEVDYRYSPISVILALPEREEKA